METEQLLRLVRAQAKCLGSQRIFFSDEVDDIARAEEICQGCPVLKQCKQLTEHYKVVGVTQAGRYWK